MTEDKKDGVAFYASEASLARKDLGFIIDRLEQRLSPSRLVNDATDAATERISNGLNSAQRRLKRNPIAVGAAGGLVGLFAIRQFTK